MQTVRTREFLRYGSRIDKFDRINIVQPPLSWQAAKAERDEAEQRAGFLTYACSMANGYASMFEVYPAGFRPCENYILNSTWMDDISDEDIEADMDSGCHSYCGHCNDGVTITDAGILHKLYEKHVAINSADAWWRRGVPGPAQLASRAPLADESMPIYMASNTGYGINTGHVITAEDWSSSSGSMFYYQNPQPDDELLELVRAIVSSDAETRNLKLERSANDRKTRERSSYSTKLTEFFSI
jgi:hypothetical protein